MLFPKASRLAREIFADLTPMQKVQLLRHASRPYTLDAAYAAPALAAARGDLAHFFNGVVRAAVVAKRCFEGSRYGHVRNLLGHLKGNCVSIAVTLIARMQGH